MAQHHDQFQAVRKMLESIVHTAEAICSKHISSNPHNEHAVERLSEKSLHIDASISAGQHHRKWRLRQDDAWQHRQTQCYRMLRDYGGLCLLPLHCVLNAADNFSKL